MFFIVYFSVKKCMQNAFSPKPPQKCKNKRVRFDATPDSASAPKKRSPKRIRTLKNEFAKSNILLTRESNKKHPATCKDVTDRSKLNLILLFFFFFLFKYFKFKEDWHIQTFSLY